MYYVYEIFNPITNLPFYVGKGKGNRVHTHLKWKNSGINKQAREEIIAIREQGKEVEVRFLAEGIEDEQEAYRIEKEAILKYGRRKYENGGILTNITIVALPPNSKGLSYKEKYGDRAADVIAKRLATQRKNAIKYPPMSEEMKAEYSLKFSGEGNPFYGKVHSDETKRKISESRKGNNWSSQMHVATFDGRVFIIDKGIPDFCKSHNLKHTAFENLQGGRVMTKGSVAGWRVFNLTKALRGDSTKIIEEFVRIGVLTLVDERYHLRNSELTFDPEAIVPEDLSIIVDWLR